MTEFLTSRKIGFMFGCFGFILAHLGRFWVGIAECGAHVGLWVCHHGVLMGSRADSETRTADSETNGHADSETKTADSEINRHADSETKKRGLGN